MRATRKEDTSSEIGSKDNGTTGEERVELWAELEVQEVMKLPAGRATMGFKEANASCKR